MTSTRRALLAGRRDLPIVEMKVGRKFIRGCADDRIKQARCAELSRSRANRVPGRWPKAWTGNRTFSPSAISALTDLLQGNMFAKPMAPRKFECAMLARHYAAVA
jgi:hypothetical protein